MKLKKSVSSCFATKNINFQTTIIRHDNLLRKTNSATKKIKDPMDKAEWIQLFHSIRWAIVYKFYRKTCRNCRIPSNPSTTLQTKPRNQIFSWRITYKITYIRTKGNINLANKSWPLRFKMSKFSCQWRIRKAVIKQKCSKNVISKTIPRTIWNTINQKRSYLIRFKLFKWRCSIHSRSFKSTILQKRLRTTIETFKMEPNVAI